jgi:hypothetical protein
MEWRNASLRNEMTRLLRCTGGATGGHRINVVARCVATIAGAARIALRLLACCHQAASPQRTQSYTHKVLCPRKNNENRAYPLKFPRNFQK